jgi:hypothetical protein
MRLTDHAANPHAAVGGHEPDPLPGHLVKKLSAIQQFSVVVSLPTMPGRVWKNLHCHPRSVGSNWSRVVRQEMIHEWIKVALRGPGATVKSPVA